VSEGETGLFEAIQALVRAGPALEIDANLSVTVDRTRLAVSTQAGRLRVQVPSVSACARLARGERGRLLAAAALLAEAGETAEIRVGDAVVAVAGADAVPGPLARRLGLGPVELRPRGVAAAALRLR
jgi:hypothetical protein